MLWGVGQEPLRSPSGKAFWGVIEEKRAKAWRGARLAPLQQIAAGAAPKIMEPPAPLLGNSSVGAPQGAMFLREPLWERRKARPLIASPASG